MKKMSFYLSFIYKYIDIFFDTLCVLIFFAIVIIGGMQVFVRYVLHSNLTWSQEVLQYLLIWLVFVTLGIGMRRNAHIGMDAFINKVPIFLQKIMKSLNYIIAMFFSVIVIHYTFGIIRISMHQLTPTLRIHIGIIYYGLVLGGIYTFIIGLRFFIESTNNFRESNEDSNR